MDAAFANDATLDDMERWIAAWHAEYEGDDELSAYLGMTGSEYASWLKDASTLSDITTGGITTGGAASMRGPSTISPGPASHGLPVSLPSM